MGKTAEDYYREKQGLIEESDQVESEEPSEENIKAQLLKKDDKSGMEVSYISGGNY